MFFHIDESGNTGNNLFDPNQPRLSYGVLSSVTNVDARGVDLHKKIQREIGEELIHANELGIEGIKKIAPLLIDLQNRMKFDFDYYYIDKTTYALVIFFDAVFDAGLNDAVKWDVYWTPMRYLVIHKLTALFDEVLLKEAWRLCTTKDVDKHVEAIVTLLTELIRRAEDSVLDSRSKEIVVDACKFGIAKPLSLDFGFPDQKLISPNAVCFQFVVSALGGRLRKKGRKNALSIVVDRQAQFNGAQIGTHYNLGRIAEGIKNAPHKEKSFYLKHPLFVNLDEEYITHKGLPKKEIRVLKSADSIGLQITDVYLWIVNKIISGAYLPDELRYLGSLFLGRSLYDGISLEGMANRFAQFERLLPKFEELTADQLELAKSVVEEHRSKVRSLDI